jgi:hypothetical protein
MCKLVKRIDFLLLTALCISVSALLLHLWFYLLLIWKALPLDIGLDYAEGIVWQQTELFATGRGYGRIDTLPYIVFPYPPVFYGLAAATERVFGLSGLEAGRLVSNVSSWLTGLFAGVIIFLAGNREAGRRAAVLSAIIGVLVIISFNPFSGIRF